MKKENLIFLMLMLLIFSITEINARRIIMYDNETLNINLFEEDGFSEASLFSNFIQIDTSGKLLGNGIINLSSIRCYPYSLSTNSDASLTEAFGEIELKNLKNKTYTGMLWGLCQNIFINDSVRIKTMSGSISLDSKKDNSSITGWFGFDIWIKDGQVSENLLLLDLVYDERIDKQEQKISLLESWKNTITTTINNLLNSISTLTNKTNSYEARIKNLESKNQSYFINITFPNYFKYLSSSDRKKMACGYAADNHLNNFIDLGYNCTLAYKPSPSGERVNCKCKELK